MTATVIRRQFQTVINDSGGGVEARSNGGVGKPGLAASWCDHNNPAVNNGM